MKNVVRYEFPVENNIDLLRLLAALQVMLIHAMHHLHKVDIQSSVALAVLDHIPGVPLFFFLSGLLIMKSYDRAESFRRYAKNRFLRLYPALWICVALSLLMLVVTGYLGLSELSNPRVIAWLFTQATFLQFYNPEIFYDFGVGVINSSLWTISVEFQFYLLAPILYFLYRFKFCYISLFILSISANILLNQFDLREIFIGKLLRVSALPWLYMFMTGHLIVANWQRIQRFFCNSVTYWFIALVASIAFSFYGSFQTNLRLGGNSIWPVHFFVLAGFALALSLKAPAMSKKILHGNDISYGLYIYHMPIINLVVFYGLHEHYLSALAVFGASVFMAAVSWRFIERPALRLKSYTIFKR